MKRVKELISSGKTLSKKEREAVERHIWTNSKEVSAKQFDYLCGQAAVRGDFYSRYKKGLVK